MFNGLQLLMKKDLLVLNDTFYAWICVHSDIAVRFTVLVSFMEFMKQVVRAKPPRPHSQICPCSTEFLKMGHKDKQWLPPKSKARNNP